MSRYVLNLRDVDRTRRALVGGKGANLGELARMEGVRVPAGFCVTTDAFELMMAAAPALGEHLERLLRLEPDDGVEIGALSARLRSALETTAIPDAVASEIIDGLARLGEQSPCAVRSSATAEDLPTASFAGQHDTYLNVRGKASVLRRVSQCWGSLFTERALAYRLRHGIAHRSVGMAVIVQRMIVPQVSGVLFTADPVNGNRKISSVEASFGLGEALVSGLVTADVYKVREGEVVAKTIASKQLAIDILPGGGTRERSIEAERQSRPALTDAQAVRLVQLGRRIEAHLERPQDIEWCLVDDDFHIVQSRPITTLFPIPAADDGENHVYVSVGHQQMMTDAMKPLGISLRQLTAVRPMPEAGGRLFVDVSQALASPRSRAALLNLAKSDPLIGDALQTIVERGFIAPRPDEDPGGPPGAADPATLPTDPAIVTELIAASEASIALLQRDIRAHSGPALLDFILADIQELKRILFSPRSHQAIMAGMEATWWLNDHLLDWLGEKNAADTLTRSVPNNVTSEMGLALLDVADAVRPHPEVVAFLERSRGEDLLQELPRVEGGGEAREAILRWLDRHGVRGVGEIDITRPRWIERPASLVPLLLDNVKNFEAGAAKRKFEQGLQDAAEKEADLLARLRRLPDGERKAEETKRMIDRVRTFCGYREYPKYGMVSRYFVYKQALLAEATRLVNAGVLREQHDVFYLTFQELHDVVRTRQVDDELIRRRREEFTTYEALTPPRVLTSDGEVISGAYRRGGIPPGALVGLPVSAGTVEGRARVVLDMGRADLETGDILVTTYTDPSWTPLFVAIEGLVTEVGGLMTHGAVIAREYGLPAVVGVEHATRLIRDGDRIRVHGREGYVEILREPDRRAATS